MRTLVIPLGLAAALLSPAVPAQGAAPAAMPAMLPAPQAEEAAGPLTLDDALALASARSFTLSAAGHELDAAEGGIMQARVLPNPEVAVLHEADQAA